MPKYVALMALVATTAFAQPQPEVDALLTRLGASNCEFNRNGSWYPGAEARAHLQKKLDYLQGKGRINTTEDFIRLAASGSSVSGQPYQVRCPGRPAVPSEQWLQQQLQAVRGGG